MCQGRFWQSLIHVCFKFKKLWAILQCHMIDDVITCYLTCVSNGCVKEDFDKVWYMYVSNLKSYKQFFNTTWLMMSSFSDWHVSVVSVSRKMLTKFDVCMFIQTQVMNDFLQSKSVTSHLIDNGVYVLVYVFYSWVKCLFVLLFMLL